jgi:hypothetical protein
MVDDVGMAGPAEIDTVSSRHYAAQSSDVAVANTAMPGSCHRQVKGKGEKPLPISLSYINNKYIPHFLFS